MPIRVHAPSQGLEFGCFFSCIASATKGAIKTAPDAFKDRVDSLLNLPAEFVKAIGDEKTRFFQSFKHLSGTWYDTMKGTFNGLWDGIVEIAKFHWESLVKTCEIFRKYKDYINIGVQLYTGDYYRAAANMAVVASEAMGTELPGAEMLKNDSEIVKAAEFLCKAIDTTNAIVALANSAPPPPPVGASSCPDGTIALLDGSCVSPLIAKYRLTATQTAGARLTGKDGGAIPRGVPSNARTAPPPPPPGVTSAKPKSKLPIVLVGGSAAALFLLAR